MGVVGLHESLFDKTLIQNLVLPTIRHNVFFNVNKSGEESCLQLVDFSDSIGRLDLYYSNLPLLCEQKIDPATRDNPFYTYEDPAVLDVSTYHLDHCRRV